MQWAHTFQFHLSSTVSTSALTPNGEVPISKRFLTQDGQTFNKVGTKHMTLKCLFHITVHKELIYENWKIAF